MYGGAGHMAARWDAVKRLGAYVWRRPVARFDMGCSRLYKDRL